MQGRKIPAGTRTPEVMHVKVYQMTMKMLAFFIKMSRWSDIKVLIVLACVSNRRVASLSNLWSSWHRN